MTTNQSIIAIYLSHNVAEDAVKELQKSGFDMKKLSIVGKDFHSEEQVRGFYNTGDRVKFWGKLGAFWVVSGDSFLGRCSCSCRSSGISSSWGHWQVLSPQPSKVRRSGRHHRSGCCSGEYWHPERFHTEIRNRS